MRPDLPLGTIRWEAVDGAGEAVGGKCPWCPVLPRSELFRWGKMYHPAPHAGVPPTPPAEARDRLATLLLKELRGERPWLVRERRRSPCAQSSTIEA